MEVHRNFVVVGGANKRKRGDQDQAANKRKRVQREREVQLLVNGKYKVQEIEDGSALNRTKDALDKIINEWKPRFPEMYSPDGYDYEMSRISNFKKWYKHQTRPTWETFRDKMLQSEEWYEGADEGNVIVSSSDYTIRIQRKDFEGGLIQDRWVTAAEDIGWSDFLVAGKGGLDALCDKVKERNALEEKFEELLSPIVQEMSLLKNGVIVYTPKKNTGPVLVQLYPLTPNPQNMYYPVEAGRADRQTKVQKLGDGLYVYTPSKEYLSRNRRDTMQFRMLGGRTTSLVPPGGGAKIEATVYSLRLVQ